MPDLQYTPKMRAQTSIDPNRVINEATVVCLAPTSCTEKSIKPNIQYTDYKQVKCLELQIEKKTITGQLSKIEQGTADIKHSKQPASLMIRMQQLYDLDSLAN